MLQRGQTATEYIIIVAVVIVIALVGATILGIFPGIGSSSGERVERSTYLTKEVAIENFAIQTDGSTIILRNNYARELQVSDISIEDFNCNSSQLPRSLKPGKTITIDCEVNSSQVTAFNPDINILWCDTDLAQSYNIKYGNEDGNFLYNGTCGGSSSGMAVPPPPFACDSAAAGGFYYNGTGTLAKPYGVCNCSMLEDVGQTLGANFTLLTDIDCSMSSGWNGGLGFAPIGTASFNGGPEFEGTFDGQGYTVSHVDMDRTTNYVGFFGGIGFSGNASNFRMDNLSVRTTGVGPGGFVGVLRGNLSKIGVNVNVTSAGSNVVGGLAGAAREGAAIRNVYTTGTVRADGDASGLVAAMQSSATITNCWSNVSVKSSGTRNAGLTSSMNGLSITNCFAVGDVQSGSEAGGAIGRTFGGSYTNMYYNNQPNNPAVCIGAGGGSCTAISNNEAYFYTITNAPLSSWDFTNVWSNANNGVALPDLQ